MKNTKQVIYVLPDAEEIEVNEFEKLPNDEKLHVAKNSNECYIYSLEDFQNAFNQELISDLGFIYFV